MIIFSLTADGAELVTSSAERSSEEGRVPAAEGVENALIVDVGGVAHAVDALSVDQLVVLKHHYYYYYIS